MWSITITSPATHSEKGEDATRYICLGGYLRSLSWGDSWALWTPMKWSSSRHGHAGWLYLWPTSWSHGWLSPSSLQDSPPPLVGKSSRQLELLLPLGSPSSCGPRWPRGQAPRLPARWNLSLVQRWPSHQSTSLAHLCPQTGSAGRQDACRGRVAGTELLSLDSGQQTGQAWWAPLARRCVGKSSPLQFRRRRSDVRTCRQVDGRQGTACQKGTQPRPGCTWLLPPTDHSAGNCPRACLGQNWGLWSWKGL